MPRIIFCVEQEKMSKMAHLHKSKIRNSIAGSSSRSIVQEKGLHYACRRTRHAYDPRAMNTYLSAAAHPTSRRALLIGAAAAFCTSRARAEEASTFRVGTLPFGAVQWSIQTIIDNGLDKNAGIRVENVPLASNEAARIAFLSGSVDAIVNDLLFAARLKSEGKPILFMPYSSTEGGLMVAAPSPIKAIADLKGKSIGVAGGPLDKSWLLLQAGARREAKLDLTKDARPIFGAPPLLAAKVESGELDCGLLYWSTCARLQAKGYREVFTVEDVASRLGAKGKIALVGFLFKDNAKPQVLEAFGKAVRRAEALLSDNPDAWKAIRPLMQAKDDETFEALKRAFLRGIPRKPRANEIADAQSFFSVVAELGGAPLVGTARTIPDSLYVDQAVFG